MSLCSLELREVHGKMRETERSGTKDAKAREGRTYKWPLLPSLSVSSLRSSRFSLLSFLADSLSRSSLVDAGYTQAARRRRGCSRCVWIDAAACYWRRKWTLPVHSPFLVLSPLPPAGLCLPPRKCLYSPLRFVPVAVHVSLLSACLP